MDCIEKDQEKTPPKSYADYTSDHSTVEYCWYGSEELLQLALNSRLTEACIVVTNATELKMIPQKHIQDADTHNSS